MPGLDTLLQIPLQDGSQRIFVLIQFINILKRILHIIHILIRDNQHFLASRKTQTTNPLAGIRFIQNVDVRLGIFACDVVDIGYARQKILDNEIRFQFFFRRDNLIYRSSL